MSEYEYNDFEFNDIEELSLKEDNYNNSYNRKDNEKLYNFQDIDLNKYNSNQQPYNNQNKYVNEINDDRNYIKKENIKIQTNDIHDCEKEKNNYNEIDKNTFLTGTKINKNNNNYFTNSDNNNIFDYHNNDNSNNNNNSNNKNYNNNNDNNNDLNNNDKNNKDFNNEMNNEEEEEIEEETEEEEEEEEKKVEVKEEGIDSTIKPIINEKEQSKVILNQRYNNINKMSLKYKIKKLNDKNNKIKLSIKKKKKKIIDLNDAEKYYLSIKPDIENILENNCEKESEIRKENEKLLKIFSQLNEIVSIIQNNTKIEKIKNYNYKKEEIDLSKNNDKLINQYQKEYNKLNSKINKLINPDYSDKIEYEKEKLLKDIEFYKKQNKDLINKQKIDSILLSRQLKQLNSFSYKKFRPENNYNNLKAIYNKLNQQKEKNIQRKKDNETKLNELNYHKEKIEQIAKEMYNIYEFINVSEKDKNEKEKLKLKSDLEKKNEIINIAFGVNKKKFEIEIKNNEKLIYEKEKEKLDLLKEMKNEMKRNENLSEIVNKIYEPLEGYEKKKNVDYPVNSIFDEIAKKELEKEKLLREKNLLNQPKEKFENIQLEEKVKNEENKNKNDVENKNINKIENGSDDKKYGVNVKVEQKESIFNQKEKIEKKNDEKKIEIKKEKIYVQDKDIKNKNENQSIEIENKDKIENKEDEFIRIKKIRRPNFHFKMKVQENENKKNNNNSINNNSIPQENKAENESNTEPLNESVVDQEYNLEDNEEKINQENKENNYFKNGKDKSSEEINDFINETVEDIPIQENNYNNKYNNNNDNFNNFNNLLEEHPPQKNNKYKGILDDFDELNDF